MKKRFLPILLVLCTVLMLGMNAFAGTEGGERLAVVAKNTGTIDMTNAAVKEAVFDAASNYITITSQDGTQSAKIYTAWDAGALYFYAEVNDPQLSKFIQRNSTAPDTKTDQEVYREYEAKISTKKDSIPSNAETVADPMNPSQTLKDRLEAEQGRGAWITPWSLPAIEIMVDPSNEQKNDQANANIYQARTTFSGYNCSYIPFKDSKLSYNMYGADRFTSITNCEFDTQGNATGRYQIKIKFTAANLGQMSFEDWQQISVHSIVYFSTSSGAVDEEWYSVDVAHMKTNNNWDAPNYSYYRLWDPASTEYVGANASEVAANYTETSITTPAPLTGLRPKETTSTTRRTVATTAAAATTTAAPADKGGCGSILSGAVAVLATAMIAVPVVIIKRKDD